MRVVNHLVQEAGSGLKQRAGDHPDPSSGETQVVALRDVTHVASRVAYSHRHLTGHHGFSCRGHGRPVVLGGGLGVVLQERGKPLCDAPGRDHPDVLIALGVNLFSRGNDVPVVRQHHHVVGRDSLHCGQQVSRRRVHGLTPSHYTPHPQGPEDVTDTRTVGHGHHGTRHRVSNVLGVDQDLVADPCLLLDLLEQVGNSDPVWAAYGDPRLNGATYVIGVDVAVPDPVAPNHHNRVPQGGPRLLEAVDQPVRCVKEVHDLVASPRCPVGAVVIGTPFGRRRRNLRRVGQRPSVNNSEHGVQQKQVSASPSVHHAGLGQHGQQFGCPGQTLTTGRSGRLGHGLQIAASFSNDLRCHR